jgi:S1-C subfamily serine protease
LVLGLAVVVLGSGGAGAGIALAVSNNGSAASGPGSLPTAAPVPGNSATFNVSAIAARVEQATVDITANGPDGEDEGTGMVLTASGTVLTNNHVIDGSTALKAQINGAGTVYTATVLGTDATDDVALLQLHGASNFKTVTIGNSSAVTVGDQVVAIGNALALPGPETVTSGIVSSTKRSISVTDSSTGLSENLKGLFQISAPINPGNSGGPLVDSAGQVVGMNTAQATSTGSGESASDVGFSIPINNAMAIARLITAGKASATVQIGPHAIMGVEVTSVACAEGEDGCTPLGEQSGPFGIPVGGSTYQAPATKGAVVLEVENGDPAASAGLTAGDVIVSIDGRTVTSPTDLTAQMSQQRVGDKVTISWLGTNGAHHTSSLRLVAGPNV